jgi:alkylhydroperoxidase/carboxymuconolactone decarboxylase family protein YurZ
LNEDQIRLLALISSAAVLRKYARLRKMILNAKELKIPAEQIYEALLQTYLFAGFPSALLSLKILNELYPASTDHRYEHDEHKLKAAGEKNSRKIYGSKFEKLIYNVNSFSPELSEWLVIEGYGKVFSRKYLSLKQRELLIISVLSSLKFESQLYSHINGAYRLKIDPSLIKNVIKDLEQLNKKSSAFGFAVLNKYIDKKKR